MYKWKFHPLNGNEAFEPQFLAELCDTVNDGFGGLQDCSVEVLQVRLRKCQLLGLLENPLGGTIYGCVMLTIGDYSVNLNGQIEQKLAEWSFNGDNGDSLVVVAKLPRVESQATDFACPGREALLARAS